MPHISNMHSDLIIAILQSSTMQRIIDILTSRRIHRAYLNMAQIFSFFNVLLRNFVILRRQAVQDGFRKLSELHIMFQ